MTVNTKIFIIGLLVAIIPFLGVPLIWKTGFTVFFGVYLILSSISINLPRKPLAKRVRKKEKITPVFTENSPEIKPEEGDKQF